MSQVIFSLFNPKLVKNLPCQFPLWFITCSIFLYHITTLCQRYAEHFIRFSHSHCHPLIDKTSVPLNNRFQVHKLGVRPAFFHFSRAFQSPNQRQSELITTDMIQPHKYFRNLVIIFFQHMAFTSFSFHVF